MTLSLESGRMDWKVADRISNPEYRQGREGVKSYYKNRLSNMDVDCGLGNAGFRHEQSSLSILQCSCHLGKIPVALRCPFGV